MLASMASCAKCDQVLLCVIAIVAAELLMMHFQVGHGSAGLASPAIALQYLMSKLVVAPGIQPQPRTLL